MASTIPQLGDYLTAWRRQWTWVVAATILCGMLGLVFASVSQNTYESRAIVLLRPLSTDPLEQLAENGRIDTLTERERALSTALAADVAEDLGGGLDPLALQEGLRVIATVDAAVLDFVYEHPDPQEAARRSQAFADAYLDDRADRARSALEQVNSDLDQRLALLVDEERALSAELRELLADENGNGVADGDPERIDQVQADLDVTRERRILLETEQARTRVITVEVGDVLSPAPVPTSPAGPSGSIVAAAALVLGAVLGLVVALVMERTSDELVDVPGVTDLFAVPTIGYVADTRPRAPTAEITTAEITSSVRRSSVMVQHLRPDARTVVLLGQGDPEAVRLIGAELVTALSRSRSASFIDATASDADDEPAMSGNGLHLAHEDSVVADIVVVAASSLTVSTVGLQIASEPGCIVVPVVRLGHTSRSQVREALRDLRLVGADIPGVIVVGPGENAQRPSTARVGAAD